MGNRLASLLCGSSSQEFVPCAACRAADGEDAKASPWWVDGECLLCRAKNRGSFKDRKREKEKMAKSGVETYTSGMEKKGGKGEFDVLRRTIAKFLAVRVGHGTTDHGPAREAEKIGFVGTSSDVESDVKGSPLLRVTEMLVDKWNRGWPDDSLNFIASAKSEDDTDSDSDSDEEYFMAPEEQEPSLPPPKRPKVSHGEGEMARKRPTTSRGEKELPTKRPMTSHGEPNKPPMEIPYFGMLPPAFTWPPTAIPGEASGSKPNTSPSSIPDLTFSPSSPPTTQPPTPYEILHEILTAPVPTQLFGIPEDEDGGSKPNTPSSITISSASPSSPPTTQPPTPYEMLTDPFPMPLFSIEMSLFSIPDEENRGSKPNTPSSITISSASPSSQPTSRPPTPYEVLTAPFPTQLFEDHERAISLGSPSPYSSEDDADPRRWDRSPAPSPEPVPPTISPQRPVSDEPVFMTAMARHGISIEDDDPPVSFHAHVDEQDVFAHHLSQLAFSSSPREPFPAPQPPQPPTTPGPRTKKVRFHLPSTIPTIDLTPPPDGTLPREVTQVHLTPTEVDQSKLWADSRYFGATRNMRNRLRRMERETIANRRAKRLKTAILAKTGDMIEARSEATRARRETGWRNYLAGFVDDGRGGWRGVDEVAGWSSRSPLCECKRDRQGKRKWCRPCRTELWPRGLNISGEEYLAGFAKEPEK